MNLPRAYARGIFSPRFVGREIPPKRNFLRFHPQSYDCGISRRGIKLDELLKGVKGARTSLVNLEELPDSEIEKLHEQFRNLHVKYQQELERRKSKKGN